MYKNFSKYVLRTPLFSINYFLELTNDKFITDEKFLKEFENPIIKEAIYLASPVLFEEMNKWSENKIKNVKDVNKIRNSFLKYLTRLSSRCTPFGLFAGSSLGFINDKNSIVLDSQNHSRNTRLDMNLTGLIIRNIENIEHIKAQLLFYPNTSIYNCGNQIRYVESNLINENLIYQIVEIDNSEYLSRVINSCSEGLRIAELSKIIVEEEISLDEATYYIYELINNQILISELQQTVSGDESLIQLLKVLEKIECPNGLIDTLKLIDIKIKELDFKLGNNINKYKEIVSLIDSFNLQFNEKHVFQTDLILKNKFNYINKEIENKVVKCLGFLNKVTFLGENNEMIDFKNLFLERYENKEMPLSLVLDNENGIGYPIKSNIESNTLIEGLSFYNKTINPSKKIVWTPLQTLLLKKITYALQNNIKNIQIKDSDINDLETDWSDLPTTLTSVIQIVKISDKETLIMSAAGGSSATNYLGRFCHGDKEINDFVSEICAFEEKFYDNKIIAEIIHLPEDRIGNILIRPSFRNYEIPYLSNSFKPKEKQIKIEDILISVKNNKIVLRSKRENKEIIPILSNAHNYSMSSLPIYRFLCDFQFNEKRNYIGFDTSFFGNEFSYLPRITYEDIILSTAKWILEPDEIKILSKITDEILFNSEVTRWVNKKNLPQYIYFLEGDNKLLVNLNNVSSINMFFAIASRLNKIMVEEFLFEEKSNCVNLNDEHYVNEIVFTFYDDTSNNNY